MIDHPSDLFSAGTKRRGFWRAADPGRRGGPSRRICPLLLMTASLSIAISPSPRGQAGPATPKPVSGRPFSADKIIPADVLARVELLRKELELIRFEMGQAKDQPSPIMVSDAAPREVVFHALTLLRKANQLGFELTGRSGPELQLNLPEVIRPLYVWKIVDAAYQRLLEVKRKLAITQEIEESRQEDSTTSSQVFRAIVQANRQFDLLFRQRLSADDTFQQVTLATRYMALLLARFPGTTPMPPLPPFKRGKRPVDVYNLVVQCFKRLHAIAQQSGIETLKLETPEMGADVGDSTVIRPTDVYDVSILLVAELAHLHEQLKDVAPPVQVEQTDPKVPAHVYQKAGLLLLQLNELETRVKVNPDWLSQ
ncbi:MAG: hypothetical protein ACE5JX_01720 [Acidobacteriota bacterium]